MIQEPSRIFFSRIGDLIFRFLKALFPVLLTGIPVVILNWGIGTERARVFEDEKRRQLEHFLRPLSERLENETQLSFWIEKFLRKIKAGVLSQVRRIKSPHELAGVVGGDIPLAMPRGSGKPAKASPSGRFAGTPPSLDDRCRVWSFYFPQNSHGNSPVICRHTNLETDYSTILSGLFKDLGEYIALQRSSGSGGENKTRDSGSLKSSWVERLKPLFGKGISIDLFSEDFRGKAFNVVFKDQFYLMTWDLVFFQDKPIAGILVLMPVSPNPGFQAIQLCLDNWTAKNFFPAFIAMPLGPDHLLRPPIIHPGLIKTDVIDFLDFFQSQIQAQGQVGKVGNPPVVNILSPFVGKVLSFGDKREFWAHLTPIDPITGRSGVLIGKAPAPGIPFSEKVAWWIKLLWASGWVLLLIYRWLFSSFPIMGIKMQLILWFSGVLAIPLALSFTGSIRSLADLESNLINRAKTQLASNLSRLEGRVINFGNRYIESCQGMFDKPDITNALLETQIGRQTPSACLDEFWRLFPAMKKNHLPLGIAVHGYKGFLIDSARFPERLRKFVLNLFVMPLGKAVFNPQIFPPPPIIKELREEPAVAEPKVDFESEIKVQFNGAQWHHDMIYTTKLGFRNLILGLKFLKLQEVNSFLVVSFWDPQKLLKTIMKNELEKEVNSEKNETSFYTCFQTSANKGFSELGDSLPGGANYIDLRQIGIKGLQKPYWRLREKEGDLVFAFPSKRLPNFVLAGQTSLLPVRIAIRNEISRLFFLGLSLLALSVSCGYLLSLRLSIPLEKMTRLLESVADGNLDNLIAEDRKDELGQTAKNLNHMTQWLRERSKMSQFVAPQVLDVIGQGGYSSALQGTKKNVIVLVSDIRNFTTLSESFPPKEIFSCLNFHMERMTPAIQENGGAIDRFIGDAIQAVFYEDNGELPVLKSIRAALKMKQAHLQINEMRKERGLFTYEIGIGLETGTVIAGVMGDPKTRLDFSVMGEPLQQASELEASSKKGSATRVVVSEKIRSEARDSFDFIPVPDTTEMWELSSYSEKQAGKRTPGKISESEDFGLNGEDSGSQTSSPQRFEEAAPEKGLAGQGVDDSTIFGNLLKFILLILLWLAPPFIIYSGFQSWKNKVVSGRIIELKTSLAEALYGAGSSLEPEYQANVFLNTAMQDIVSQAGNANDSPAGIIRRKIPMLREVFPNASFFSFLHIPGVSPDFAGKKFLESTKPAVFEDRSPFPGFPTDQMTNLAHFFKIQVLADNFQHPYPLLNVFLNTWGENVREEFEKVAGSSNFLEIGRVLAGSLGKVQSVNLPIGMHWMYWEPLVKNEQWGSNKPLGEKNLLGMFFCYIPLADLNQESSLRCFVKNQERNGFQVGLFPQKGTGKASVISQGLSGNMFVASSPMDLPDGISSVGNWYYGQDTISLGIPYRIVLARKQEGENFQVVLTGNLLLLFGLIWGTVGIFSIIRGKYLARTLALSLRWQLAGAMVLFLFPTLIAVYFSEKENLDEKLVRVYSDQKRNLLEDSANLDRSFTLFSAFACNLIRERVNEGSHLAEFSGEFQKPLPPASRTNNVLLFNLYKIFSNFGLKSKMISICGINGVGAGFNIDKNFLEFLQGHFEPTLTSLNPGLEGKRDERLLKNYLADKLQETIRWLLTPGKYSAWITSPESLGLLQMTGGAGEQYLYNLYIYYNSRPVFSLLMEWDGKSLLGLFLNDLERLASVAPDGMFDFSLGMRNIPGLFFVPPFIFFSQEWARFSDPVSFLRDKNLEKLSPTLRIQAPGIRKLAERASKTDEEASEIIQLGENSYFVSALPGVNLNRYVFTRKRSVEQVIAPHSHAALVRGLFLGVITLISLCLSVLASDRFLSPLKALSEAAWRIRKRDFEVRIPVTRKDEFGRLSEAFNKMAKGVQEGRLLSYFVSESVKDVVKSRESESTAREGENIDVVVLFANLCGFKEYLRKSDPAKVISNLNLFHERMAGTIRSAGGDIDKFIGEKILAVFHPRKIGSIEKAQEACLNAAFAMQSGLAELPAWKAATVGIGMVAGNVLSGILGSAQVRLEFTVIGDTVNLASRLCDLASKQGGGIVIDEQAMAILERVGGPKTSAGSGFPWVVEPLGEVSLKGKTKKIKAYRIVQN